MGETHFEFESKVLRVVDAQNKPLELLYSTPKLIGELVRILFLLFVLISLVAYFGDYIPNDKDTARNFFAIVLAFIIVNLSALYLIGKKKKLAVEMYERQLSYPYFYFWKRRLSYESIFSFERLKWHGEDITYVVGEIDGSCIFFNREWFGDKEDFNTLGKMIGEIAAKNKDSRSKSRHLFVQRRTNSNLLVQLFFVIIWGAILVLLHQISKLDYYQALEVGALTKIVKQGEEVFRLTSNFNLHLNIFHILSNILAFAFMAESLLRLIDVFRFLIVLFLSALIASIFSLYLSPHEYVIGASGGIFGLFGAYCVVKFTKYLPGTVSLRSNKMVLAIIALQIATEYFVDGIDSYSHAGGFIAGALCMNTYLYFAKAQTIYKSALGEKVLAVLLSGVYLWGLVTFLFKVYA